MGSRTCYPLNVTIQLGDDLFFLVIDNTALKKMSTELFSQQTTYVISNASLEIPLVRRRSPIFRQNQLICTRQACTWNSPILNA